MNPISPTPSAPPFVMDPAVLALLRCPRTGRPLKLENRQGHAVLRTDDGRAEYPIIGGIPVLLPEGPPPNPAPST